VDFIARGSGYSVFLSAGDATIAVTTHELPDRRFDSAATHEARVSMIELTLVGSRPARAIAQDQLPGTANYFGGRDPAKWRRDLPTFAKVRYPNVYQGIDVVYYGNQGRLEYDFVIAPGADPSAITLGFSGATAQIENNGDLTLALAGGATTMRRPFIYQEIGGNTRAITGDYVKRADGRIGFTVGTYDRTQPLVIDPVLLYSTLIGGRGMTICQCNRDRSIGQRYITADHLETTFQSGHRSVRGA
jgi:hypothetical protein